MGYRLPPVPESRLAYLAERLAYAALAVVVVAVLAVRAGKAEPVVGIVVVTASMVLAAAAVAIGAVAGLEIWRFGYLGLGRAFRAMMVAALLLAYPAVLAARALRLPVLNDITTDIEDPPVFSSSRIALLARGGHKPPDIDRRRRTAQTHAYPMLRPILIDAEPEEAFRQVSRAVKALKWQVIEEIRPEDRRGLARIDAIDESRLMRLPDDITIRLRAQGAQTRIDVRAASRVGRHDLGGHAARIERLAQEILLAGE
jgi:uncharacterized protein (DUF1499 family)